MEGTGAEPFGTPSFPSHDCPGVLVKEASRHVERVGVVHHADGGALRGRVPVSRTNLGETIRLGGERPLTLVETAVDRNGGRRAPGDEAWELGTGASPFRRNLRENDRRKEMC